MLKASLNSPTLKLIIGLILLYTSSMEVFRELQSDEPMLIGAHHGVLLFALLHVLKALPDIFDGVSDVSNKEK